MIELTFLVPHHSTCIPMRRGSARQHSSRSGIWKDTSTESIASCSSAAHTAPGSSEHATRTPDGTTTSNDTSTSSAGHCRGNDASSHSTTTIAAIDLVSNEEQRLPTFSAYVADFPFTTFFHAQYDALRLPLSRGASPNTTRSAGKVSS
jgi:hypothetical protein